MKAQIYLFFFIFWCFACQNKNKADVSHIPLHIQIERFDRELASLNDKNMEQKNAHWQQRYGLFYTDYMQYLLSAGSVSDTAALYENLRTIITTPDFKALEQEVSHIFPDLDKQSEGLTDAFRRIKYYFPQASIPRFISFFSGFGVQCPINEDYIGIGLDMFLGADSKFYPALTSSIPQYLSRRFTPENIVPRCTETYLREELLPDTGNAKTMLDHMIYQGKIMYLMDKMLPETQDSLKIGYESTQMVWANSYEREIWAWMLEEKLLYSTDYPLFQRYLADAPFTAELGKPGESAPKLGVYIGWKIVRKYMSKNEKTSLAELLSIPAQSLLSKANYKGSS